MIIIYVLVLYLSICTGDMPLAPSYHDPYNRSWQLNYIKGVMKGQTIVLQTLINTYNNYHTCYNVTCLGGGCQLHNKQSSSISICYPAIIITGLPKCGTTAMYNLLTKYKHSIIMHDKENCPYARRRPHWQYFNSLPRMNEVIENKLVIDGCIDINANMIMRGLLRNPKTLYIVMTRNYADMLWSSYNFWCRWDIDGTSCDSTRWAKVGIHIRSPDIFHEIVSADVYNRPLANDTKNPMFNSRPCAYAGGYYSEFLLLNLWNKMSRNQTIAIASEELSSNPLNVWYKISKRFDGLSYHDFDLGTFLDYRTNTHTHNNVLVKHYQEGIYEISNYTNIHNETKILLNKCWLEDCVRMSQLTGYIYPACENEVKQLLLSGGFKSFIDIYKDTNIQFDSVKYKLSDDLISFTNL